MDRELAKLQAAAKELLGSWKFVLEHDCAQGSISPRLFSGAEAAENRAESTQAKWGAHRRDGGYYWATYKVGVFCSCLLTLVFAVPTHLHNVKTRVKCSQTILSLDFQCRDNVSD